MNIAQNLRNEIEKQLIELHLTSSSLFLFRQDGILLYKNNQASLDEEVIGALLSGIWQASLAVKSVLPSLEIKSTDEFRLSFDTSSEGIYLFPTNILRKDCFWALIYSDETNPGQKKLKLRQLAKGIENFLENGEKKNITNTSGPFSELTDEEIDFAFRQKKRN